MAISKLSEPTLLTDQVYAKLLQAIVNGDFPSGYRLRVRDLADQVGTSVMPVREAIRRLEEAGLAEREPHKGAVVKALSLAELVHVYDVRLVLECEAARLGASNIDARGLREMTAEYKKLRTAIDKRQAVSYLDHDEKLLATLYGAGGNPVLLGLIRTLWQQCRAYKLVGANATLDVDPESLWRHQYALIDAAERHDAESAVAVTRAALLDATSRIRAELPTTAD